MSLQGDDYGGGGGVDGSVGAERGLGDRTRSSVLKLCRVLSFGRMRSPVLNCVAFIFRCSMTLQMICRGEICFIVHDELNQECMMFNGFF